MIGRRTVALVRRLCGAEAGVSAVELALILPAFVMLIYGMLQCGVMLQANSGMRQAVEAGARYASLYPRPTDAQIRNRILSRNFGLDPQKVVGPTLTRGTRGGLPTIEIDMRYRSDVELIFMPPRTVEMRYKRLVYQAPVIG